MVDCGFHYTITAFQNLRIICMNSLHAASLLFTYHMTTVMYILLCIHCMSALLYCVLCTICGLCSIPVSGICVINLHFTHVIVYIQPLMDPTLRTRALQEHYMKQVTNCWLFYFRSSLLYMHKNNMKETIVIHMFKHFLCLHCPVQRNGAFGTDPGNIESENTLWM